MSNLENVTTEDVINHLANSVEGYQEGDLYFATPRVVAEGLMVTVEDEDENERNWVLRVYEV